MVKITRKDKINWIVDRKLYRRDLGTDKASRKKALSQLSDADLEIIIRDISESLKNSSDKIAQSYINGYR